MKKNRFLLLPEKLSRWYWVVGLIILEFLFLWGFNGMFSFSVLKLKALSGYGLPDELYYYNYHQLYHIFESYGVKGRQIYLHLQWIDMIYPIIYSLLLSSLLSVFYKNSKFKGLVFLPFFALVFDYSENIFLRTSILSFPHMNTTWVTIASFSTALKWTFILLSFTLLLIGSVTKIVLIQIRKHKSHIF